ncbi:MAG: hypothetical protein H0X36_15365 [Sphingomonadaceae bacterium]|nr:hypothetical protein [Sphingomonadaceae bacterium]
MRRTVQPYWVQLVWTANVLGYVLALWWGVYWWHRLSEWTFQGFTFLTGYSIVLFMLAAILFPTEARENLDFEDYFFENRRWFFGLLTLALLLDIPETLAKSTSHLRDVPVEYRLYIPFALALSVTGLFTANRRVHAGLCMAYMAAFTAYLTLTLLDRIAIQIGGG